MFLWNFSVNSEYETIARKPTDEAVSFEYQLWMTDATFTVSINFGLNFGEKWKQWARFRIIFKFSILPEYFIPRRVVKDRFTLKRWLARTYIFSIIKYYFIFLSLFVTFASSKPWRFFYLVCVFIPWKFSLEKGIPLVIMSMQPENEQSFSLVIMYLHVETSNEDLFHVHQMKAAHFSV